MSYYKDQISKINTKSEHPAKIKLFDAEFKCNDTNHLSLNPESAQVLIDWLTKNYLTPAQSKIEFTRLNNDTNGNPRYVCDMDNFLKDSEMGITIDISYPLALKRAKQLGGRKFDNKQFCRGIVFQSYNIQALEEKIHQLLKELQ